MVAKTQNEVFRWDDARILLALHRSGTLSGAAQALGVNPSTVGRRLDALEEGLGIRLFDRTPDGVLATGPAEQLFPFAESLERAAADLTHAVAGMESEPEGVVRLTAPPGLAEELLAPALGRLYQKHPRLRLELDASVGYADLTRREADLALRASRPQSGDLIARKLAEAPSVILASKSMAAHFEKASSLEEIPWITYGPELGHIPDAHWILHQVPEDQVVLRTNSYTAQIAAASAGLGAVVTAPIVRSSRGLVQVKLKKRLRKSIAAFPLSSLWLVGHRALRHVPRVQAVWAFLVEVGAQLTQSGNRA
jgi:DNA-binding transcriptional LysR family regulator